MLGRLTFIPLRVALLLATAAGILLPALVVPASASLLAAQLATCAAVLLVVLGWRLTRDLHTLKWQAGQLATADPHPAVEWQGNDELAQVGQQLTLAREQVLDLLGELDAKSVALHRLATHDGLTGLPQRNLLAQIFEHHAALAKRQSRSMAVWVVELDSRSHVDNALGQEAHDKFVRQTAMRLQQCLRDSDVLCRAGDDEFVVLLPQVGSWQQVASACERVLAALATSQDALASAAPVASAASVAHIGVAMYPGDATDFAALQRMAGAALQRSQGPGQAHYAFYQPDMDAELRRLKTLAQELQSAVAGQQLALYYQPVVDVGRGRVVGCDAVLRWPHPSRGLLWPQEFIPAVADSAWLAGLARWMVAQACADYAQWCNTGTGLEFLTIHMTHAQWSNPGLPRVLHEAMQTFGLRPREVALALSECDRALGSDAALRQSAQWRQAGAGRVVTNFGAGALSLLQLKQLRPDRLNIDAQFVHDLPDDPEACSLTATVAGLARNLSITVAAEGVATAAQRDWLHSLGCSLQQGLLHGAPMVAREMAQRLNAPLLGTGPS